MKLIKIGVIGNSNKGKSFILSKLSKIALPSGTSIRTEGLSVKYPDCELFKNRKIALLDSAGLETPVIKDKIDKENKKENVGGIEKNINISKENNNKNELDNRKNSNRENGENTGNELFKEKSREKIMTELFLQNYIIYNSDFLIVVVGILTYSEQKILNRIKSELKRARINKTLYIIHNLITYTTVDQVKSYIVETLLNSATFELEEHIIINMEIEQRTKGVCYHEKSNVPQMYQIYHLIYANEYSDAGKEYNSTYCQTCLAC